MVILQLDPAVLEVEVKYVQFWKKQFHGQNLIDQRTSATTPAPQLFSKTQQTPKEEAQAPLELPLETTKNYKAVFYTFYFTL